MAKKQKYTVVREHGAFAEGDERVAFAADVQHLIPHCLELIGDADEDEEAEETDGEKSEDEPLNKAEPAAPANKATAPKARKATKGA